MLAAARLLLALACLLLALLALARAAPHDPHEHSACQPEPDAPPQEKMALPRRQARQRIFQAHVHPDQPTLGELLAEPSTFDPAQASVTAILNHWSRRTICRQIDGLRGQSVPPRYIWVCLFASPMAAQIRAAVAAYNDSRISLIEGEHNFKYYGRFQLALAAPTRHVLVLDDDMLPGPRYLQQLLHVVHIPARRALLGSIGWLLPRPGAGLRFGSYRSLVNGSGGLYVPDLAYDIHIERLMEVDYLCSMWFGEARWFRLLWREAPRTFATGEDFQLSHMLRKHAGIPSRVLPVDAADAATWGDTDHALAYARYSTGGRQTIELRDSLWWRALQGGGTFHWARDRPTGATLMLLLDGAAHAAHLAPLLPRLLASSAVAPLVVLAGSVGGECARIAPLLGLGAKACDERRLRVLSMELGRDAPVADAPAADAPAAAEADPAAATARGGPGRLRAARAQAEALRDLGGMLDATKPALLLYVDDPASAASRAAAQLGRLRPALPTLVLPPAQPPFALGWIGAAPLPALVRWREAALSVGVLVWGAPGGLTRLRASLQGALLLSDQVSLSLQLQRGASAEAVSAAQAWAWPHGRKQLRLRTQTTPPVANASAAYAARDRAAAAAEAWMPRVGGAGAQAFVLLDDGVEVAPAFYLLLKRFLLASGAETGGAAHARAGLLGVALGPPEAGGGESTDVVPPPGLPARAAVASSCGALYLAEPWAALHEHVAAQLTAEPAVADEAGGTSWAALQRGFMRARGHQMLFPGVPLCRRQGDQKTRLASEREAEALLASDHWILAGKQRVSYGFTAELN